MKTVYIRDAFESNYTHIDKDNESVIINLLLQLHYNVDTKKGYINVYTKGLADIQDVIKFIEAAEKLL